MNILLVKPSWLYPYSKGEYTYNRIWPPLSLANCAAILEKNGFKVKILDCHALRIRPRKIRDYVKGFNKVFITSSSLDRWQCPNIDIRPFLEAVNYLKRIVDDVYILGYHGTVEPEKILNLTKVKAVVIGEPEDAVRDICQNNELSGIKGCAFNNGSETVITSTREAVDLKTLPVPAYHLLNFGNYSYEILGDNFALFEISRGCKFNCKFCNKTMYGERLRSKSKDQILEEITLAVEKHGVKTGYFIDLDFLSVREIVEDICHYLIKKKYKFKWTCQTRPDCLDEEILRKMKMAGCKIVHMGIETGLQEKLNYFNKSITVEKMTEAVELCRKVGIKTFIFLLFDLPGETNRDREKTYNFAEQLDSDYVSFHRIFPYKGTDIYHDNFERDINLDKFIRKAFIKYYLNPCHLHRLGFPFLSQAMKLLWGRINSL